MNANQKARSVGLAMCLGLASLSRATMAVTPIAPGDTHTFTGIDGDGISCRVGKHVVECRELIFSGTGSPSQGLRALAVSIDVPDERRLSAGYNRVATTMTGLPPLSIPQHAASSTYNDFTISGPAGRIVEAQVSVTFDGVSEILGGGAFKSAVKISLGVSDVTDGAPGVGIASYDLFKAERSNEQGFTDVAIGTERQVLVGEISSFVVKLRTGRTYRLTFGVEVMGEGIIAGLTLAVFGHAGWQSLSVMVDGGPNVTAATTAGQDLEGLLLGMEALQARLEALSSRLERLEARLNSTRK